MASPLSPSGHVHVTDQRWTTRTWAALMLLCGVLFLDGLDVSMVGVALPSIRQDLGLSTAQLQWIVSGYVLGYGGLLLLGGRAADLLGRRRVLIVGLSVFTVASLLGGLVSDPNLLIATRFLQGASAAFTAPAGLSYITTTFAEGPVRNKALSVYTAFGASGFSSGLILGGLLTQAGWRFTFLLPVPFALLILAAAPRLLAKDAPAEGPRPGFDLPGAVTITAGMLLLVRTVVRAPDVGWVWALGPPAPSAAGGGRSRSVAGGVGASKVSSMRWPRNLPCGALTSTSPAKSARSTHISSCASPARWNDAVSRQAASSMAGLPPSPESIGALTRPRPRRVATFSFVAYSSFSVTTVVSTPPASDARCVTSTSGTWSEDSIESRPSVR